MLLLSQCEVTSPLRERSLFPALELGWTFVTVSTNRTEVTLGHKKPHGLCVAGPLQTQSPEHHSEKYGYPKLLCWGGHTG